MKRVGVSILDVEQMGLLSNPKVRLPLTPRDRALLSRLESHADAEIQAEAQAMLRLGCKAEIEALNMMGENYLMEFYLGKKLQQIAAEEPEAEGEQPGGGEAKEEEEKGMHPDGPEQADPSNFHAAFGHHPDDGVEPMSIDQEDVDAAADWF